jgi:hypothetical protein
MLGGRRRHRITFAIKIRMQILKIIGTLLAYVLAGSVAFFLLFIGATSVFPDLFLNEVSRSHIDGNVPRGSDFDTFLKRDLSAYFTLEPNAKVEYELLTSAPSQVGVGLPKYYIWVSVHTSTGELQGAARVAAIEQKEFSLIQFISAEEIKADPKVLEWIFPAALIQKIRDHVK